MPATVMDVITIADAWLGLPRSVVRKSFEQGQDYRAADHLAAFAMNRALELGPGESVETCLAFRLLISVLSCLQQWAASSF